MDLSHLSTEDLQALKAGDLSKVSTAGLQSLRGGPAPQAQDTPKPATFGNTLLGEAELLGSAVGNIPHAAAHAAVDLGRRLTGGDTHAPDPAIVQALQVPTGEAAKNLVQNVSDMLPASNPNNAQDAIDKMRTARLQQLPQVGDPATVQDVVQQTGDVAGDVAALAPVVGGTRAVVQGVRNAAERAALERAGATPLSEQIGLRTGKEAVPGAQTAAGPSAQNALKAHNTDIGVAIAKNESGIPVPFQEGTTLNDNTLAAARKAPSAVFGRTAQALPTASLIADEQTAREIAAAGPESEGRITSGTPEAQAHIDRLKQQLLDPSPKTGQQVVNEVRGLRQDGYANLGSDDVSQHELGRAQLSMARALDGHIARNLPADADVTADQFLAARKALAKNFTIAGIRRGTDIDLQALVRVQRADPQLLDGGLKTLADFADENPKVAALPDRFNAPSVGHDIESVQLTKPVSWLRPAIGALGRRALTGSTPAAAGRAQAMFPGRLGDEFTAIPPPPAPRFGGYLPSPEMVNAGGGASTPNALQNLGLTPDVQAAGAAHPAAARLAQLREQLSRPPMQTVDFQGPQNWGPPGVEPKAPTGASASAYPSIPFENVLEQGGTQGKPVAGIKSGYRPAPTSPKGPVMRTPPGAPTLAEGAPPGPSAAQLSFRNKLAADRLRRLAGDLSTEGPGMSQGDPIARLRAALQRRERGFAKGGRTGPKGYLPTYAVGRNPIDNPLADATARLQGSSDDFDALAMRFLPQSPLSAVAPQGSALPMRGF